MSDPNTNPELPEGLNLPGLEPEGAETSGRARRQASVTLRKAADDAGGDMASMMDPATRSLADALRITYRLLQVTMAGLAVLFLLSGFQSIKESERGIRLVWGAVRERDLGSGFKFSFPEPIGELIRVAIGEQRVEVRKEFFPALSDQEEQQLARGEGVQSLAGGGADSLDPASDGHLITADGALAHTRWSVTYRRFSAPDWAENIDPKQEQLIVLSAVRRAIVHAAASVTMDELLKGTADANRTPGSFRTIESLAQESAQRTLDALSSGIQVQQLALTVRMPPRRSMGKYNEVVSAQSTASANIENSEKLAATVLTETAGEAAADVLTLIDRYERELATSSSDAEKTLELINRVLLGEPAEIGGRPVTAKVFGQVSTILAEAREHRTRVVNEVQGDVALYNTKWDAYLASPLVAVSTEWSDALRSFLGRDTVQSIFLPPGSDQVSLLLNRDPEITKRQITGRNRREAEDAEMRRQEDLRRARFKPTGPAESGTSVN